MQDVDKDTGEATQESHKPISYPSLGIIYIDRKNIISAVCYWCNEKTGIIGWINRNKRSGPACEGCIKTRFYAGVT